MVKTREQIERAYGVLDVIEAHPESHDQNWWVMGPDVADRPYTAARVLNECGTTACVAGWAALLAGGVTTSGCFVTMPGEREESPIPSVAAELLGLEPDEQRELFQIAGDLADVRKAIFDIFGPRPDGI